MTDEELIARLRKRAAEERDVQRNNEAVAAALMGQRLLFDQGIRSKANSFAVRLGVEHENCAKNDAKLARDWDAAADRIEALVKERDQWIEHTKNAVWSDSEELKLASARAERLEAALREIAAEASVPVRTKKKGGIKHKWMYKGWRKIATDRIDIARAALKELK